MSISDDGISMADERRTGALGFTLMELLAEQVKGGLAVGSGAGTTVTVSIPA